MLIGDCSLTIVEPTFFLGRGLVVRIGQYQNDARPEDVPNRKPEETWLASDRTHTGKFRDKK